MHEQENMRENASGTSKIFAISLWHVVESILKKCFYNSFNFIVMKIWNRIAVLEMVRKFESTCETRAHFDKLQFLNCTVVRNLKLKSTICWQNTNLLTPENQFCPLIPIEEGNCASVDNLLTSKRAVSAFWLESERVRKWVRAIPVARSRGCERARDVERSRALNFRVALRNLEGFLWGE